MKTMKHIPWMLLAVLAFATACTQDELTDNPSATSQTLEIASATIARAEGDEATTTNAGTGTVDGNWVEEDEITVWFGTFNYTTATYEYRNGDFTSDNPINCNGQTANAQAWTNCGVTTGITGMPDQWKVETNQSGEGYRQSDFLYATTLQYEVGAGTPVNFTFYHQTAKIVVHVRNSGIVKGKTGLCMKVGDDNICIYGNVSLFDETMIWSQQNTPSTITPYNLGSQSMSDGNTSLVSFGALVIPQTIAEGETLFTFTVDGQTYYYEVPSGGIKWETRKEYTYNVTIIGEAEVVVNSVTQGDWGDGGSYDLSTQ